MQKNSEKIFSEIEVDPVTGDYYVTVPEVILNEMQWYEGTTLRWLVDGNEIVLAEERALDNRYIMLYDSKVNCYSYGKRIHGKGKNAGQKNSRVGLR